MLSTLLLRFALLLLFCLGNRLAATASHIMGGDIAYSYISGSASRYHIVARLYARDPAQGLPDQPQVTLFFTRNGCSSTTPGSFSVMANRSQLAVRNLGCVGNGVYRVLTFETDVTLPPDRWTITTMGENRSNINNLANPFTESYNISAYLDNSSGLTNSSPFFTSFTLPYVCGSQPYRYSFSTFEADGDSLVYRAVAPMASSLGSTTVCGSAITYATYAGGQFQDPISGQTASYPAGQFTPALPILSFRAINGVAVPQFELNARNGDLLTTPVSRLGLYTVVVRVDEYRQLNGVWTQIGSVVRDVVYSVLSTVNNRNPTFTSLMVAGASTAQSVEQAIPVQAGQTVAVTFTAADPDAGQTMQLSSDVAAMMPGASFQVQGANQGVLTWQVPATLLPGRYNATVTVADSNCPIGGSEIRTITFVVTGQPLSTRTNPKSVLAAYPMPFHNQVQFKLPTAAVQTVTITDGLGRLVDTITSLPDGTVQWVPAADVATGAYFARPTSGGYVCRLLRQ